MEALHEAVMSGRNEKHATTPRHKLQRQQLRVKQYAGEACVTLFLFLLAGAGHFFVNPSPLVFIERDPNLSFPLVSETVPKQALFTLSIGVPCVVVAIMHTLHCRRARSSASQCMRSMVWVTLSLLQCLAVCFAITTALKGFAGQARPNFFALCDYAGYRNASRTGDFNAYSAHTVPGMFGDLSKCASPHVRDVADAQHSFASGHSAVAFAGMTFTCLYLRAALGVNNGAHFNVHSFMSAVPLVIAVIIAVSRVRDYFHRTPDIIAGAAIGVISALAGWSNYVAHRRARLAPRTGAATLQMTNDPLLSMVGVSPRGGSMGPRSQPVMSVASPSVERKEEEQREGPIVAGLSVDTGQEVLQLNQRRGSELQRMAAAAADAAAVADVADENQPSSLRRRIVVDAATAYQQSRSPDGHADASEKEKK